MSLSNEALIEHLINHDKLTADMAKEFVAKILGKSINASQIAGILAILRIKGVDGHELGYLADELIEHAALIERPNYVYADIVGTGGDGHNTINVSTLASLTAAWLGLPVAKHGNTSVSSKCGSADVLRELGIDINQNAQGVRNSLDMHKWTFLFAPNFHPTYQAVKEVRKDLGIKTVFNILGPLVNPMAPPVMLIGVYHRDLLRPFIDVLKYLKRERAMIVHGSGLDEIALHGPTQALFLDNGEITPMALDAKMLGLKSFPLDAIKGGTPQENALLFKKVLMGTACDAHLSLVAASAGALLWLGKKHDSLKEAVMLAYETLKSGQVQAMLEKLRG